MNREEWLTQAATEVAPVLEAAGRKLPALRLTCGFPRGRKAALWQAWPAQASGDGTVEVLVSPEVADAGAVLAVLLGALAAVAAAPLATVGLEPDGALTDDRWLPIIDSLGEYPHAALTIQRGPTQSTRMLKAACPSCGYVIRLTARWAAHGLPVCPADKSTFKLEEK